MIPRPGRIGLAHLRSHTELGVSFSRCHAEGKLFLVSVLRTDNPIGPDRGATTVAQSRRSSELAQQIVIGTNVR